MLIVDHASLYYAGKPIFTQLHFEVEKGEWLAIMGQSGVGKTSLLRLIAGLHQHRPETATKIVGTVSWDGSQEFDVAYMAQQDGLFPWLSVEKNVLLPYLLSGEKEFNSRKNGSLVPSLLRSVKLENYAKEKPAQLSGGMRQRVALARTLIQTTDLVLMDEPFSALDAMTRMEMQALSFDLIRQAKKTVVMVTHDPWEALRLADTIIILAGTPAQIATKIKLPRMQGLRDISTPKVLGYYQELLEFLAVS